MDKTIDQFYADTYNNLFSLFNAYNKRLIELLQSLVNTPPQTILDLACGTGLSTLALRLNFGDAKIIGVDIDSNLIASAQETVPHSQI